MPTNEIKQFAGAADANVLTQAQYAALTTILSDGFQPGVLPSRYLNKVLRQVAFMAAGLAKFIENAGENVLDDGDIDALVTSLETALGGISAATATDLAGGVANQIPWQSGVGNTSFLGPTNSAILTTNGSGVPSLTAASSVTVGTATNATNALKKGADLSVGTIALGKIYGGGPGFEIGATCDSSFILYHSAGWSTPTGTWISLGCFDDTYGAVGSPTLYDWLQLAYRSA